jgi:hypothetical protein
VAAPRARLTAALGAALLIIGGLVLGVVLSEGMYRVSLRWVCLSRSGGVGYEQHDWGWLHRPNRAGWAYDCIGRRYEWRTWVTTNSHGLRDREVGYEKPPGTRRVLVLGDSITEALQVPWEKTFAHLLEEELRADGGAIEVINGGHAGFGTDNELLFYEHEGRRYAPDLVLLVFNLQNDVLENFAPLYHRAYRTTQLAWPPKPSFSLAADGTLSAEPAPPMPTPAASLPRSAWQTLQDEVFVVRSVARLVEPAPPPRMMPYPVHLEVYWPWSDEWSEAWRLTARLVRELRTAVERDGARFAVVVMPAREMVQPVAFVPPPPGSGASLGQYDPDRLRRIVTGFLAEDRVPFLDLFPALRAAAASGPRAFFVADVHLTELGNAVTARAMKPFVDAQLAAH